jgi:opacity protein-like surface antigen
MKKITALLAAAGLLAATSGIALAADNADTTVTYQVTAINEISVSGNPGALVVSTATAGSEPNAVTEATTYAITTNGTDKKITGAIDEAMPTNVTLTAELAAPTGGSSAGAVALTASDQALVSGISTLAEDGIGIDLTLSATAAAGVVGSDTRTLTLTIADGI